MTFNDFEKRHASQIQTVHGFIASWLHCLVFQGCFLLRVSGGVLFGLIEPVDTVPGLGSDGGS